MNAQGGSQGPRPIEGRKVGGGVAGRGKDEGFPVVSENEGRGGRHQGGVQTMPSGVQGAAGKPQAAAESLDLAPAQARVPVKVMAGSPFLRKGANREEEQ